MLKEQISSARTYCVSSYLISKMFALNKKNSTPLIYVDLFTNFYLNFETIYIVLAESSWTCKLKSENQVRRNQLIFYIRESSQKPPDDISLPPIVCIVNYYLLTT